MSPSSSTRRRKGMSAADILVAHARQRRLGLVLRCSSSPRLSHSCRDRRAQRAGRMVAARRPPQRLGGSSCSAFFCWRSACARSRRWCCHDGAAAEPSQQCAVDRGAGAPALRPRARDFPAGAFPRAWARHRRRSEARRLPALDRSAAGEARRRRPRFPARGAYAGRPAAAGDREPGLARRPEADRRRSRPALSAVIAFIFLARVF